MAWLIPVVPGVPAPQKPLEVSLIQLIANPEKFDGKLVAVYGLLGLGEQPVLWLHKEDGDNFLLPNALWIFPNHDMEKNAEKIDNMYVVIVGVFRAFQPGRRAYGLLEGLNGIEDVKSCTVWSDPNHPVGHKYDGWFHDGLLPAPR